MTKPRQPRLRQAANKPASQKPSEPSEPLSEEALAAFNAWREEEGFPPLPAIQTLFPRLVHLSDEAWDGIEQLAISLSYVRGRSGNRRQFLEALGQGLLLVERPRHNQRSNQEVQPEVQPEA